MGTISLSLPSDGQTIDVSDVNTPFNTISTVINGNLDDDNIKTGANINGSKLLAASIPGAKLDSTTYGGWIAGVLPAVSSVTYNGNRSYDVTFASTVASYLTPGMRVRFTRTVAAPTYMGGAFNGTNHYFTKATPSGTLGTVTNNFTLMAWVNPTSYGSQRMILCRADSTPNNGLYIMQESTGQITCGVISGGGANFRNVTTYQSLPLNKKTHVAASWTGGTVVIYFDGVSVPVQAATTGGTAPTTAGTGGDFSIGRCGAANQQYFTGYISGAGVFNAVLTGSTILSYASQVLSGSETNCIGAWSLNNTANDQSSAANNLTATNSVSYTSGTAPYATDSTGTSGGTYDYGIVTKVATTVATIQVPEGCAIPTSGGVSAVDLSSVKVPFGFPTQRERWQVSYFLMSTQGAGTSATTYYNVASAQLNVPIGSFHLDVHGQMYLYNSGAGGVDQFVFFVGTASATSAVLDKKLYVNAYLKGYTGVEIFQPVHMEADYNFSTATTIYLNEYSTNALTSASWHAGNTQIGRAVEINATPTHL